MKWWRYYQNNSGGNWIGPQLVYIEAASLNAANEAAQSLAGVYFNGCDSGEDCDCCGDRWHDPDGPFLTLEEAKAGYDGDYFGSKSIQVFNGLGVEIERKGKW